MADDRFRFDVPGHRPVFRDRTPFARGDEASIEFGCSCGEWVHSTIYFRPADEERARDRAYLKHASHVGLVERRERARPTPAVGSQTAGASTSSADKVGLFVLAGIVVAAVGLTLILGLRSAGTEEVAPGPGWNGGPAQATSPEPEPTAVAPTSRRPRPAKPSPKTQPQTQPRPPSSSGPGLPPSVVEEIAVLGEQTGYTFAGAAPDAAADLALDLRTDLHRFDHLAA